MTIKLTENKLKQMIAESVRKELEKKLKNGNSPKDVFNSTFNITEDLTAVLSDKGWNFMDKQGNILCDQWFGNIGSFNEGYIQVELNHKWNFIDLHGNYLSKKWFDNVGELSEGRAAVQLGKGWRFIDLSGKILGTRSFDYIFPFKNNCARVLLGNKCGFINKYGDLMNDYLFDDETDFEDGIAIVELNGLFNYFIYFWNGTRGEILKPSMWFETVSFFHNGKASVKFNGEWYYMDKSGKLTKDEEARMARKIGYLGTTNKGPFSPDF